MAETKTSGMKPVEVAIIAVLVGVAGFFGGMKYSDMQRTNQRSAMSRQFGGANGASGPRGNRGGRPVIGDVVSVDPTTMTVKLADGSSRIVVLSETTTVSATAPAAKTDIQVGSKVGAYGTDNADGSMTAQSVQLNPAFGAGMMGGRGGAAGASGSPTQR